MGQVTIRFVVWEYEGCPCPAPGCSETVKSVMLLKRLVSKDQGPQGGWQCGAGHGGYIWPAECNQ